MLLGDQGMKALAVSVFAGTLRAALGLASALTLPACSGATGQTTFYGHCGFIPEADESERATGALRINEVMTGNDGVWLDDAGQTDDFVELFNTSDEPVLLRHYFLGDRVGRATRLPDLTLAPGETLLFWADNTPEQGSLHLPFKLSNSGTPLLLWADPCQLVDRVSVPELPRSESYARLPDGDGDFEVCRFATPERKNGDTCEPPPPANLVDDVVFADFDWPEPFPAIAGPLVLSELALRPASFVEVLNASDDEVALADFELRLARMAPGESLPGRFRGVLLAWPEPEGMLAAGERVVVPVTANDTAELTPLEFDGVVTLFQTGQPEPSDRLEFMAWPEGAALSRVPDESGFPRFCEAPSPAKSNDACRELAERELPTGRAHRLATPGDFEALARGGTDLAELGVKFVIDMQAGGVVHLLGTEDWALHYTWVREMIEGKPHLDRCDPLQAQQFDIGWILFSQAEYFRVEGRRYLLGTLVVHQNGSKTVEFTPGDQILGEQMRSAFFSVMGVVDEPTEWAIRPTEARQIDQLRLIEGTVPIVGPNAAYVGLTYQALNPAVGYGTLTFVPAHELETAELGPNVIVVTDDVPNESAFMGGLITEAFQTPLAHVNVLARGRNTPNMALRAARKDPRLVDLFGKLVRLEVKSSDFALREATGEEADAYWQARTPTGPKLAPARDLSVRGVVPLELSGYGEVASIGSKSAGIAELYRVASYNQYCPSSTLPLYVPPLAFAIPFSHYVEHFEASGARALLEGLEADANFRADPHAHAAGLAGVRELVLTHAVDPELLAAVTAAIAERFAQAKVRFRSSSNTEDLATFNGAGLHTSTSADIDGSSNSVEGALRTVWSSLWNTRAYDERAFGNIDQSQAAMAVLVHQAWQSEAAQGVAISRNALHATRDSQYYINAQVGEASVTNPAPGVTSDELVYTLPPRPPKVDYQARSSLSRGADVLSFSEIEGLACALSSIHSHFLPLVDPQQQNRLYAMQIEWKLVGPTRRLLVKQARPYSFGSLEVPDDCREF